MVEAKKKTNANVVEVEGYLKENTLAETVTKTHKAAIMGTLTIALSDKEDYRLRFMAMKTNSSGEENPAYKALARLLPEKTVTIATLLKANPQATFEEVRIQATPVWARGSFELYDRKNEKGEVISSVTLRGQTAGMKTAQSKTPFALKATFKVDGIVMSKQEEKVGDASTGRTIVKLMIPDHFREVGMPMDFVCEGDIANSSIENLYERGDSGQFAGRLFNSREEQIITNKTVTYTDGSSDETTRVVTVFTNERRVTKVTNPFMEEEAPYISPQVMNQYLTNREAKLEELEVTSAANSASANTNAQPISQGVALANGNPEKKFTF